MSLIARQLQQVSGFDPRSLPGLEGWYDAANPLGFGVAAPADSTSVSQWNDLSGKNRHLTQATSANQPLFRKAGVNLLNAQRSTGGDVSASTANFAGPNGATISYDTSLAFRGTGSIKSVLPAVAGSSSGITVQDFIIGTGAGRLAPNTTYTYTGYGYNSSSNGSTSSLKLSVQGTGVNSGTGSVNMTVKGAWTRMTTTFTTLSSGNVTLYLLNGASSPSTAGDTIWGDCFQLELGSTATPWMPPCAFPSVYMSGISTALSNTSMPTTSELTVYISKQGFSIVSFSGFFTYGGDQKQISLSSGSTSIGISYRVDQGPDALNQTRAYAVKPLYDLAPHVLRTVTSFSHQTGLLGLDGSNASVLNLTGPSTPMPGQMNLVSNSTSGKQYSIGTLLVYSTAHNLATQRRVEQWLAGRYGVTLERQ